MRRRDFLKTAAGGAGAAASMGLAAGGESAKPAAFAAGRAPVRLSACGCGRATGYAEANKIVTVEGKTHVAWLDSPKEGFRVRVRTLDRRTGTWSQTYTVGEAHDNHGGPALAVDSKGFLHVAYYPHHHPMRYRRSKRPNDASEWTRAEKIGRRCTYPTLVVGPDDTLYLTCRESTKGPWQVSRYVKPPGKAWQGPKAILRARFGGYAHFQEALAWGPDGRTLHLSCRIYEGPGGREQRVGYLVSRDFGETWRRADGAEVALPATAETIDVLARCAPGEGPKSGGQALRCGALAVGADGRPIVLYSAAGRSGGLFLARPDGRGKWGRRSLLAAMARERPGWSLKMPGGIATVGAQRLFVAATVVKPTGAADEVLWGHPTSQVVLLESADGGRTWRPHFVSEGLDRGPNWLPNMERPTGHNRVDVPALIFTSGTRGKKNTELLSNHVYWARPRKR